MSALTFIHTADIHFGVENYGRIDSKTGIHTRLLDFEKALSSCIDTALEQDVDLFVFSGDAYKTPYPTPTQQKLLLQQFFRLSEANIPLVIVVGNHDHPLSFGRAHALDLFGNIRHNNFYVFGKPGAVKIETKSGPINVVGIPWPMRNNIMAKEEHTGKSAAQIADYLSEQVTKIIAQFARGLEKDIPALLAGHLTVSTGVFSGSEKRAVFGTDPLFMPSQLAIEPFDYVALGHLHRFQDLNKGGVPVVYSGSPERVDFGERKEPKGFCLGSIQVANGKKTTNYSFHELTVRPMIQIEVTLDEKSDIEHTEQVLAAVNKHDITDAIIKIKYYVPTGSADKVDTARVQRACRAAHYLTGILPVYNQILRTQRQTSSSGIAPDRLLEIYFDNQQIEKKRRKELVGLAQDIIHEVERSEEQGDEAVNEKNQTL